jgi:hypothetical protein
MARTLQEIEDARAHEVRRQREARRKAAQEVDRQRARQAVQIRLEAAYQRAKAIEAAPIVIRGGDPFPGGGP